MSSAKLHFVISDKDLIRNRRIISKTECFGNKSHNVILGNTFAELHTQLKNSPCAIYVSRIQVRVNPSLYLCPDIVAVCGEEQFDETNTILFNPTVIIEVLPASTEAYTQNDKFHQYRQHDSLREYMLIAQDKLRVEHYVRQSGNQWLFSETGNLQETVQLPSINGCLTLADVYNRVEKVHGNAIAVNHKNVPLLSFEG